MSANALSTNAFPASTFSTSSLSYVDLLNGSGGAVISVSITKAAGTSLLVRASMSARQNAANATITLGVNDGTTDHYVAENRNFATCDVVLAGMTIISGLGAGTFTIKLRIKLDAANQCNFGVDHSAALMVMEIAP
jgi:hypothetical protein